MSTAPGAPVDNLVGAVFGRPRLEPGFPDSRAAASHSRGAWLRSAVGPWLDLSADLVGERFHRDGRAIPRRVRLELVERALEREELLVCERCPAVDEAELRHVLTVGLSPRPGAIAAHAAEQVEELRQFQGAQLHAYQAKLAPHVKRPLRNDDGEILYDGNGDDRRPIETPDVQVGQLWLRVLEQRAKLYGLDVQQGLYVPQVTAEMFAAFFFDETDPRYMGDRPIDVDGEEVDDDREALCLGSGD